MIHRKISNGAITNLLLEQSQHISKQKTDIQHWYISKSRSVSNIIVKTCFCDWVTALCWFLNRKRTHYNSDTLVWNIAIASERPIMTGSQKCTRHRCIGRLVSGSFTFSRSRTVEIQTNEFRRQNNAYLYYRIRFDRGRLVRSFFRLYRRRRRIWRIFP